MKRILRAVLLLIALGSIADALPLADGSTTCPNPNTVGSTILPTNTTCTLNGTGVNAQSGWFFNGSSFDGWGNSFLTCPAGCSVGGEKATLQLCKLEAGNCVYYYKHINPPAADGTTLNGYIWLTWQNFEIQSGPSFDPLNTSIFVNNTSSSRSQPTLRQLLGAALDHDSLMVAAMPSGVPFYYDGGQLAANGVTVTFSPGAEVAAYGATLNGQGNTIITGNNNTLTGGTFMDIDGASVGAWRADTDAQNPTFENGTLSSCGTCVMGGGNNGEFTLKNMNVTGGGYGNSGGNDHNIYLSAGVNDGETVGVVNTTGTWTGITNSITLGSATNVVANLAIQGTGIRAGTKIINITGSTATLSQNTTSSETGVPIQIFDGDTCYKINHTRSENVIQQGWTLKLRAGCGVTSRDTACATASTAGCVYGSTIGCTTSYCSQNGIVDMPCGGNHIIAHSVLEKGPASQGSGYLIRYGEEGIVGSATLVSGSTTVTLGASPGGYIHVGTDIHGANIPANTTVATYDGNVTITLNNAPKGSATENVWWSSGRTCPAWGDYPTYQLTLDHDIIIDDGPNLSGWGVNNVVCMGTNDGLGNCNNPTGSPGAKSFTNWTCTVKNSIIVSNGNSGSTALILGNGCADGGGNTFFASRPSAGYPAFPYLPPPL